MFKSLKRGIFELSVSSIKQKTHFMITFSVRNSIVAAILFLYSSLMASAFSPGTLLPDFSICYNGNPPALSLSAASAGCGNVTYQWQISLDGTNFSDISGATATNYNPAALTVTTYYKRKAFDVGCTPNTVETTVLKITVYPQAIAGTIGTTQTVYCTNTVALTSIALATGGPDNSAITYQWQENSSGAYVNISGATSSTYTETALTSTRSYRRVATMASPCGAQIVNSNTVTITYSTALPATPAAITSSTGSYNFCTTTTGVVFTASAAARATSYVWTVPTGATIIGSSNTNVITVDFDGSYVGGSITCAGVNACGTGAARSRTITAGAPTTPTTITSSTGTYNFCPGKTGITFTATAVATATSYVWTLPAGVIAVSPSTTNTITVDLDGSYAGGNITCAGVNTCGAGTARSRTLTVTNPITSVGPISGATAHCNGDAQNYSVPAIAGATFTWSLPTGVIGTSTTRTIATTFDNTFTGGTLSVTATNMCGTSPAANATLTQNILAAPANITGTLGQCPGNTGVVYSTSTVTGASSYTWLVPTGVTITSQVGTQILVDFDGSYTGGNLQVAAVNACGAGNYKTVVLTLNTTCNWTWVGTTSVNWNTASNWNPASVPTSTSPVTIPSGTPFSPSVTSATANCSNLTIDAGATLTVINNRILNVFGNLVNNGTLTTGTGTSQLRPSKTSGAQTISGDLSGIKYLVKAGAGTCNINSAWTSTGRIDLRAGTLNTNGNLTIDIASGGYIGFATGDNGNISGNLTIKRYVGISSHYITSPLNGITASEINDDFAVVSSPSGLSRIVYYDVPTQTWIRQTSGVSTVLNRGTGFSFAVVTPGVLDLTGPYSQPSTSFTTSGTAPAVGSNMLVGNPFVADLDWNLAVRSNTDATMYYWNASSKSYASYNALTSASTNGGTRYIPVLQSVFVSASSAASFSVSFDRTMINNASPNANLFRTAALAENVKLKVTNTAGLSDEFVLFIDDNSTTSFDNDYDAYKMMNPATSLNLYSTLGGVNYAVNSIPSSTSNQIIDLNFKAPADGTYTLETSSLSLNGTTAKLIDNKTGLEYPVSGMNFTFDALKLDAANRFQIVLGGSTTTGVRNASNKNSGVTFGSNQSTVFVESTKATITNANIQLIDVTGNVIRTNTTSIQTGVNAINMDGVKAGMYVIKVIDTTTNATYTGSVAIQ